MACMADSSCCSLQARLHQLETARAAEMQAHGLQVRELQREADAGAEGEKQLRLELAKLRADHCRLEAEAAAASRRTRQAVEAADAMQIAHNKALKEKEAREEKKQRLVASLREELAGCQCERQQLADERLELRMTVEALRHEAASLRSTGEERLLAIKTQAAENGRLGAVVISLEHELAEIKLRYQLQEQDLGRTRSALEEDQKRRYEVGRALERALQTRNRVITWRRNWIDGLRRDVALRELFMAWRVMLLDARSSRNEQAAAVNQAAKLRLLKIQSVLLTQCVGLRDGLALGKSKWQQQGAELEALKQQVMVVELPKVLALASRVQDRREMAANDALSSCVVARDGYQHEKQKAREREDTLVELLDRLRGNTWRSRVFNRWKDWYLRRVIGETTHAAMVSRVSQPAIVTADRARSESRDWEADASETRTPESTVSSSQASGSSVAGAGAVRAGAMRKKFAGDVVILRASAAQDAEWQRWRRVASAGSAPPRRSRVLLQSPPPSPTRGCSSKQPRRSDQRRII